MWNSPPPKINNNNSNNTDLREYKIPLTIYLCRTEQVLLIFISITIQCIIIITFVYMCIYFYHIFLTASGEYYSDDKLCIIIYESYIISLPGIFVSRYVNKSVST